MRVPANSKIALDIDLKIMHSIIEQHIAASPHVVGVELARQIDQYVREQHLGYYPALDYFRGKDIVDADLYNTAESIAWLLENITRKSLNKYLLPLLGKLEFNSSHVHLFTLPHVRPSQNNAIHNLTAHLTPDHLRVSFNGKLKFGAKNETDLFNGASKEINNVLAEHFSLHDINGISRIL